MDLFSFFKKIPLLAPDEVKRWLKVKKSGDFTLLDVRQPAEYESGHLPGAVLIPLPQLLDRLNEIEGSKPVVTYCRAGGRSGSAASLLTEHGFREVYSMKGGTLAWDGPSATGGYESGMDLLKCRETAEDMVSLAWALEDGAGLFYRKVWEAVQDKDAKTIFGFLAGAEAGHKKRLLDAYREIKGKAVPDGSLMDESLKDTMEGGFSIEGTMAFLTSRGMPLSDTLETSMQLETNSLDLYTKLMRRTADEPSRHIFRSLLEEEKIHLERLGGLLDEKLKRS